MLVTVLALAAFVPSTHNHACSRTAPFHPAIHNMGNVGRMGALHADGAWFFTRLIDALAYEGRNMRAEFSKGLAEIRPKDSSILEVGCGVGTLTAELEKCEFSNVNAVDTSQEMINKAREYTKTSVYSNMNGVDAHLNFEDIDVAIVCMVMHEMPTCAHSELIQSLLKATRRDGEIWLIDIDPMYSPSVSMLAGEPYLPSYLANVEETIHKEAEMHYVNTLQVIPKRVRAWVISKR